MYRVLIVAGHKAFRQSLRDILQTGLTGVALDEARDRAEALRHIAVAKPDIALVEIRLHGDSGLRLGEDLRAGLPEVIVAVVVPRNLPEYRRAVQESGVTHVISRDASRGEVLIAMRAMLKEVRVARGTSIGH